jgi:ABC-type Fe3+ transport system permease subunit
MNWGLLENSLVVSGSTTLLCLVLGFCTALWLAGVSMRSRRWFLCAAGLALAFPPFLVTSCWLDLLGYKGAWRSWFPVEIYSIGGTIWVLSLILWPVSLFLVLGAWQKL